jgi:peptidyl-prolyl cis-trans isomerase A (cyclophilin A)
MDMKLSVAILALSLVATAAVAQEKAPAAAPAANPKVVFQTAQGDIVFELDAAKAPKTVANFLAYAKAGHFDGTIFHRVIPGFVIQGGGFTAEMVQKPTQPPIVNEFSNGLKNLRGTISMARTADPNSATSQFFINLVDNGGLDNPPGYAVFGKVVAGMEVVDAIAKVRTGSRAGHQNVPLEPILVKKAEAAK